MLSMKFRRRLYALANFTRRFASVEFRAAKRNLDRRNSDTPRNFIRLDFVLHLKFKASEILRVKISKGEI